MSTITFPSESAADDAASPTPSARAAQRRAYLVLRVAFGVLPVLAGLDKFVGLLADWSAYVDPGIARLLPVSTTAFLYAVGVIEFAVGLLVWSRYVRLGAYAASAWLVLVAGNLVLAGFFDVAARDVILAAAALALGTLAQIDEQSAMRG